MRIIVIGAGVFGASTAFHLAASGAHVTVVDAEMEGRATAAGAGIICPWASEVGDSAFMALYLEAAAYYPELIDRLADAGEPVAGYKRTGAMLVTRNPAELGHLDQICRSKNASAMGATTWLTPAETQRAFPPLRDDLSGIYIEGGARVDGRQMVKALLGGAARCGAEVRHGSAEINVRGKKVSSGSINGELVDADIVVVTAGAWVNRILEPTSMHLPVEPQRGQIVHFHLPDAITDDWPIVLPPGTHYIVPFDNGRVVAGATREQGLGFDYRVTGAGQREVLTEALRIAPGLGKATIAETRVGFRPVIAGTRPIIAWLPDVEGLAVGNGLGAGGLTMGPIAGRLLAEMVMGRKPAIDLSPFGLPDRHEPIEVAPLR